MIGRPLPVALERSPRWSSSGWGAGTRAGLRRVALALALSALPACYSYAPLTTAPEPGTRVRIELNDVGRVGMGNSVGPEVSRVEGVLQDRSDSQFVLRVTEVRGLYGGQSKWASEPVTFRSEYVRALRERRFSRSRTTVLVSSLAAGFVAFVVTRNLFGLGNESEDRSPGRPPDDQ